MIYLDLFLTFLQIGAVSFGGGYAMISLIREKALLYGWLTEEELLNMIAVSESTPGPIAVNMATFVGSTQGGMLGSFLATLGVVLPSFVIILLIAALIGNFLKYRGVQAFLGGIRPCVVGLILATGLTMLMSTLLGFKTIGERLEIDVNGIVILGLLIGISTLIRKITAKKPSPILMILISAGLGMLLYSL
ncbi:MAG: chromate transporter [Clostridia bacterium]|nr:chromate transporter [Clostridia bacterium]